MNFTPSDIRALVHRATRQTGTPVHDEDLEQDVAVRALEAFRRLERVTHPRALLMKIVQNAVTDRWRRHRCDEDLADIDPRFISQLPSFEFDIDLSRRLELLRIALERLPPARRELLDLFYIEGHSITRISKLQGRSASAVKMELLRSRHSLARIVAALARRNRSCRYKRDKF